MFIILLLLALGVVGGALWLATRPKNHWVRVIWVSAIFLAGGFGCIQLGVYLGRAIAIDNFNTPRRALGTMFAEIKEEMDSGETRKAKAQIGFIAEKWWSIDFFYSEAAQGLIPFYSFVNDYQNIKTESAQSSPETTTMAVTPQTLGKKP